MCANFNTVFFKRDRTGRIVSAEPQTPMTPLARKKTQSLGVKKGRHTFSHNRHEAARYAGELLLHHLRGRGFGCQGRVRAGTVGAGDRLIYTYRSVFTLEEVVEKMRIITAEWNKEDNVDESVRSKELSLIEAFEKKATPEDIKKYEKVLSEFEIADDSRAVNIAKKLQGKAEQEFPPVV